MKLQRDAFDAAGSGQRGDLGPEENGSLMDIPARSWSYITLGFGHGEEWWRQFCYRLKMAGYDGWLSIEHEDVLLNSLEGLEKSVALLQNVMPKAAADFKLQDI